MSSRKRLDAVPPYLFAELERKLAEKQREGIDVISLGIGDPDLPTPQPVVDALIAGARDAATHQYPTNHGSEDLREAAAAFYGDRFGVGSTRARRSCRPSAARRRSGTSHLRCSTPATSRYRRIPATRPTPPGRCLRAPSLTTFRSGGERLPPGPGRGSGRGRRTRERALPQLPEQSDGSSRAARVLRASRRVCARARSGGRPRQRLLGDLLRGIRRSELPRDPGSEGGGRRDLLDLQGLEHDRLALRPVAGNAEVVERYRQLKTNLDSGMFEAVQRATIAALTESRDFPKEMSEVYRRRRDLVAEGLTAIGLEVAPPRATPYFWVRVPEGHTSESFTGSCWSRPACSSRRGLRTGRAARASSGSP